MMLAGPEKSGHTPNLALTIICFVSWCPDFWGTLRSLVRGHAAKKDISILNSEFLSCITLK